MCVCVCVCVWYIYIYFFFFAPKKKLWNKTRTSFQHFCFDTFSFKVFICKWPLFWSPNLPRSISAWRHANERMWGLTLRQPLQPLAVLGRNGIPAVRRKKTRSINRINGKRREGKTLEGRAARLLCENRCLIITQPPKSWNTQRTFHPYFTFTSHTLVLKTKYSNVTETKPGKLLCESQFISANRLKHAQC